MPLALCSMLLKMGFAQLRAFPELFAFKSFRKKATPTGYNPLNPSYGPIVNFQ
jgi:hypothetical protein